MRKRIPNLKGRRSAEFVDANLRALDNALQCAYGNGFATVVRDDHLATIHMSPFLMTAFLSHFLEPVALQNPNNIIRVASGISLTHHTVTSTSLAESRNGMSIGSNQSSSASLALAMASSSVSPAEAHPGNSGKTEEYRPVSGSFSTMRRSFMRAMITMRREKVYRNSPIAIRGSSQSTYAAAAD